MKERRKESSQHRTNTRAECERGRERENMTSNELFLSLPMPAERLLSSSTSSSLLPSSILVSLLRFYIRRKTMSICLCVSFASVTAAVAHTMRARARRRREREKQRQSSSSSSSASLSSFSQSLVRRSSSFHPTKLLMLLLLFDDKDDVRRADGRKTKQSISS